MESSLSIYQHVLIFLLGLAITPISIYIIIWLQKCNRKEKLHLMKAESEFKKAETNYTIDDYEFDVRHITYSMSFYQLYIFFFSLFGVLGLFALVNSFWGIIEHI